MRNFPREHRICEIYFLWEWARGLCVVDTLAWWMLSSGASGVCCRLDCTKFLGLQTFGSFKGFKWMGRVQNFKLFYQTFSEGERRSFFRNFMIRIIIKCSKNIPCVSSFLFHTNVVKHEKKGQLTLKQLDAQFLTENKIKKWFSSLFISIGYISLCILTSIYLSKA